MSQQYDVIHLANGMKTLAEIVDRLLERVIVLETKLQELERNTANTEIQS